MASQRLSIYVPDHLWSAIDLPDRDQRREGLSARIAAIVDRYELIVQRSCPQFRRAEWMVLLDACNGWAAWSEAGHSLMVGLAHEVADYCRLSPPTEKWEIPVARQEALVQRLASLAPHELMAVLERVERFWRRSQMDTDQAMAEAGIEPTD